MSFFVRKGPKLHAAKKQTKRKEKPNGDAINAKKKKTLDDVISSDSEEEIEVNKSNDGQTLGNEIEETAQEKKIRLAKKYLEEIEREENLHLDDGDEADRSVMKNRLRNDVLEKEGRLIRKVADDYVGYDAERVGYLKNGHKLSVTCFVITSNMKYVYSASKDCSLVKWDFELKKKLQTVPGGRKGTEDRHVGHTADILCLAITSDNKFLASGCKNNMIKIWNPETMQFIHNFRGHRGPVSGLSFRKASHTLFSCSHDRSVKLWNLDEMSYIETLFGHQENVTAIDSLARERCITAGGRDASLRIWKIIEESQLVFQGDKGSTDCVKLIDEQHFISGSEDGSVSLWGILKKKPLHIVKHAHGLGQSEANWITSLACYVNTNLFASGSQDGCIRLWKCSDDFKRVDLLFTIPITGFVNWLEFSTDGKYLIAAIGQEHKLGRWWKIKTARNYIAIFPLKLTLK